MHLLLTQKLEEKYGRPVNTAKDCECLARMVSTGTGRVISSSTLRRFFGLLKSKSAISKFNYDTLACFCGYADFKAFAGSQVPSQNAAPLIGADLLSEMQSVTNYTLKGIERKSLVDFECTVPRKSVSELLDSFLASPYGLFPLVAPGGYGKSVALAHWVAWLQKREQCQVLFCPAAIYLQLSTAKGHQSPLVVNAHDKAFFVRLLANGGCGKLVLVIDGVDEIGGDARKMQQFMDLLFGLLGVDAKGMVVKVVLGVREVTWGQLMEPYGKSIGKHASPEASLQRPAFGYSNMPAMSVPEICTVLSNLNQELGHSIVSGYVPYELMPVLQVPLNLHLYAQMFRKTSDLVYVSRSLLFREFVNSVVFGGPLGEYKQDIVYAMVEAIEQLKTDFVVAKNHLKQRFPIHLKRETSYHNAYGELLMSGILQEERFGNDFGVITTYVRFKHQEFFYFIATHYLVEKQNGINKQLFQRVATNHQLFEMAANTVATLYEMAYEREDYEVLSDFCDLPEAILSSVPVRFSVGSSFRIHNRIRGALVLRFAQHLMGQTYFFEQFVDTNYLFNNFVDRITAYLSYKKTPEARLFGNAILFLSGFMGLQKAVCQQSIDEINSIPVDASIPPWPIGRKVACNIAFSAIVGNGHDEDWGRYIAEHQALARLNPAYWDSGLVVFEIPVMLMLAITKKYNLLVEMVERLMSDMHTRRPNDVFYALLARFQNTLPYVFMQYASFKMGRVAAPEVVAAIHPVLSQYGSAYEDFLYVIMLNQFLADCYGDMGNHELQRYHFTTSFELSKFANYRFLMASMQIHNNDSHQTLRQQGLELVAQSGFHMDVFL